MRNEIIDNIPSHLRGYAESTISVANETPNVFGILAAGSMIDNTMDKWSDLDLIILVEDENSFRNRRKDFAKSIGNLLSCFVGFHVFEPKLLICLYDKPLAHIDLKFTETSDLLIRVETPLLLWSKTDKFSKKIQKTLDMGRAEWPSKSYEWFENRFWIWIHYVATKTGRGEYYESVSGLGMIRDQVLCQLMAMQTGAKERNARRIEQSPVFPSTHLHKTVPNPSHRSCCNAIQATIDIYENLFPVSNISAQLELRNSVKSFVKALMVKIEP